ncbi:Transcription initiation factor IIA subunit 2, partial [Cucurbita argyrosperma subsp. sororia]
MSTDLREMKKSAFSILSDSLKIFWLFSSLFFYVYGPFIPPTTKGPAVSTTPDTDGHGPDGHSPDGHSPDGHSPNASVSLLQLHIQEQYVVMENGIIAVTISNPMGFVTGIQYHGIENLLDVTNPEDDRGYWDVVWNTAGAKGTKGMFDRIEATDFKVIVQNDEQIELSFSRTYNSSSGDDVVPLNVDKRFVILRNSSGFYSYAIYEHLKDWPAFNIDNTRIAFKPRKDKFRYMVVADERQRFMPLPDDRKPPRGVALEYPEAVLLVDPIEPEFKGEVDDKYQYGCESKDTRVHGWISNDPPIGIWQITASEEYRSGGPLKQVLTSHVGPTSLTVFHSAHYAGAAMVIRFGSNEAWKKVYGPVFIHINSLPEKEDPLRLWQNAKEQGYQFWSRADENGHFTLENVLSGNYSLNGWVYNFISEYQYDAFITVTPGSDIDVGELVFEPPRDGPTLWEIGIPDRTAAEFYVPDPSPKFINKLFVNHSDKFRQYGLWERYAELYPKEDLVYTVDQSDYKKDWFFAQVNRKIDDNNTYVGTTWKIEFKIDSPDTHGTYKLRLALATAHAAELQVRVNDAQTVTPLFTTGVIGKDNTIARHGIHGLYRFYSVDIPGNLVFRRRMATFELYRRSTIGMCLTETLDEMVQNGTLSPELAIQVLVQFDKSMTEALESQVKSKVTIKGHLHTYRFCDNVWTFILQDATFKNEDSQETVGRIKIVACDSKLLTQ